MKRKNTLIAAILLFSFSAIVCHAGSSTIQKPLASKAMLSELTAKVRLKVKKYKNPNGIICYSLQPIYTVTNNGMSLAKNFRVKLEWKWPKKTNWETCSFSTGNSLGPGNSKTWGPSPAEEIHWCVNDTKKAGFRVTVDDQNKVAEVKENNNVATKLFPNFKIKKQ